MTIFIAFISLQIELEFRSYVDNGLLVYSHQNDNGSGDYISLAIINGFIEFRYDLGSGPAIIKSHHRITNKKFHKVRIEYYIQNIKLIFFINPSQVISESDKLRVFTD